MSKKMLKRSLALGALMAFVITGSAMAAEQNYDLKGEDIVFDHVDNKYPASGYNGSQPNPIKINGTGVETVTFEGAVTQCALQVYGDGKIEVNNVGKVVVTEEWRSSDDNIGNSGNVFYANGGTTKTAELKFEMPNGSIVSEGTLKNAMLFHATDGGKITVNAGIIDLHTTSNSIVAQRGDGTVNSVVSLTAGSVSLESDGNAITSFNGNNNVVINATNGDASVTSNNSNAVSNSSVGSVNISASNNISLSAGLNAINVTGTNSNVTLEATGNVSLTADDNAVYFSESTNGGNIKIKGTDVDIESTGKAGGDGWHGNAILVRCLDDNKDYERTFEVDASNNLTVTAVEGKNAIYLRDSSNILTSNISAGNSLTVNGSTKLYNGKDYNISSKYINMISESDKALETYGAKADIVATESINIENTGKYGVVAQGNGNNTNIDAPKVNITATNYSVWVDDKAPQLALSANQFNITGDIGTNASGIVTIGDGGKYTEGYVANITGNVNAASDATINIDLGNGGKLEGQVSDANAGAVEGKGVNVDLGEGSTINATGNSNFSSVSGDGTIGVANLETTVDIADVSKLGEVTVSTNSDNLGADVNAGMEKLNTLVTSSNTTVADKLVATAGAMYDEVTADVVDGVVQNVEKEIASANLSVNDMVAIGLISWRAEMNDMNKRMGELRNANGEHGVWVRMVRGESEFNSVKNQYNQYQLGYDEKLSVDKRWTVGAAISYTDAENSFAEGNGESTNKAFSVYGSKLNEDGTFVDLIAKYARLENDFKTYSGMGDADYDTNAYSFSAEVGKRIQQGKGLWIEPQLELTYGKVTAVDYVTKNNVAVAQDGMESLVGRIGFSLGKDIEKGNVYARASYLYDFEGETKAVLNGVEPLKNDLGGGWWEVGVGANINLSKATYIYADVEKTFGGEVDTNWQWNLGVRYSF